MRGLSSVFQMLLHIGKGCLAIIASAEEVMKWSLDGAIFMERTWGGVRWGFVSWGVLGGGGGRVGACLGCKGRRRWVDSNQGRADLVECEDWPSRASEMEHLGRVARTPLCGHFRSLRPLGFLWTQPVCLMP